MRGPFKGVHCACHFVLVIPKVLCVDFLLDARYFPVLVLKIKIPKALPAIEYSLKWPSDFI